VSPDTLSFNQITLELKSFHHKCYIDLPRRLNQSNTKVRSELDPFLEHQAVQFDHYVYCGKPQKETYEVKYPAGWWNAFKVEYPRLCRWFAAPEYVTVKVQWEGRLAFPGLELRTGFETVPVWIGPKVEFGELK
jgi:hypothetical protein